jgi:hypothetical protein
VLGIRLGIISSNPVLDIFKEAVLIRPFYALSLLKTYSTGTRTLFIGKLLKSFLSPISPFFLLGIVNEGRIRNQSRESSDSEPKTERSDPELNPERLGSGTKAGKVRSGTKSRKVGSGTKAEKVGSRTKARKVGSRTKA